MSGAFLSNVVWPYNNFEYNFGINQKSTHLLEESCDLGYYLHFSFKYSHKTHMVARLLPELSGRYCHYRHDCV